MWSKPWSTYDLLHKSVLVHTICALFTIYLHTYTSYECWEHIIDFWWYLKGLVSFVAVIYLLVWFLDIGFRSAWSLNKILFRQLMFSMHSLGPALLRYKGKTNLPAPYIPENFSHLEGNSAFPWQKGIWNGRINSFWMENGIFCSKNISLLARWPTYNLLVLLWCIQFWADHLSTSRIH